MIRKRKIIHLFSDDKFYEDSFNLFEKLNGYQNIYLIIRPKGNFVHLKKKERLTIVDTKKEYHKFIENTDADFAFIHSMYGNTMKAVLKFPSITKVIWSAIGYDLYGSKYTNAPIEIPLHLPYTEEYAKKELTYKKKMKLLLRHIFGGASLQKRAISRIDYCVSSKREFEFLQKLPYFRANSFYWMYPFDDNFFNSPMNNANASDITIGNSSSYTSNHLDVLHKLHSIGLKKRIITIPLSYGDNKVKNLVLDHLYLLNENKVLPLTDFLPFEEYKKMQDNCGFAIFAHLRQQAMGNIKMMLYLGVKVFLHRDSMLYPELIELGFIIKHIDSPNLLQELSEPLCEKDRLHNRNLVYELYSNDSIIKRLQKCMDSH